MSTTYRRMQQKSAQKRLVESSSDVMDYRARLIYMSLRKKHPRMNPAIAKGLAETKSFFVTILQRPIEKMFAWRMKMKLHKASKH